jgi:branched-chain amino acid transport system permease protein
MREIKRSLLIALWFMVLTFPLLVIRVNTTEKIVTWRWENLLYMGLGSFAVSLVWPMLIARSRAGRTRNEPQRKEESAPPQKGLARWLKPGAIDSRAVLALKVLALFAALIYPLVASIYQVNIMASALIYVGLGLGLNIVVGMAGLLNLGYAAFYAVGAYTYALLNHHFGLGFWTVLPLGGVLAALFGIILAMPVLRLRGDYLAIVTLGFGEILRLVLENWNAFSFGPSGISQIERPGLFGMAFTVASATTYIYYILLGVIAITIFVTARLQNSRIGRALVALREDEIACQAMERAVTGLNQSLMDKVRESLREWAGHFQYLDQFDIEMTPKELSPIIQARGYTYKLNQMSKSERIFLYLMLKLAIGDAMGHLGVFVLDDPADGLDFKRQQVLAHLLQEVSGKRQVIVSTNDDRFADMFPDHSRINL